MKVVSTRELRGKLRECLRAVSSGEVVLVSEDGEVIAELRPPARVATADQPYESVLQSLADRGDIRRAAASRRGWSWRCPGLRLPSGTAETHLELLRREPSFRAA